MKIVFVQDSRFFAGPIMESLEGLGVEVVYAGNSIDCLKLLSEEPSSFTAIVADGLIARPEEFHGECVGGADALWHHIRHRSNYRELPIVLLGDKDIFDTDIHGQMMSCPRTIVIGHDRKGASNRAVEIHQAIKRLASISQTS